jgi:hypothetical protein
MTLSGKSGARRRLEDVFFSHLLGAFGVIGGYDLSKICVHFTSQKEKTSDRKCGMVDCYLN